MIGPCGQICTSCASSDSVGPSYRRSFEIRTLPADGDLMAVEFPLFRKYQICHHKENPEEVQLLSRSRKPPPHLNSRMPQGWRSKFAVHVHQSLHEEHKLLPGAEPQSLYWAADSTVGVQVTEATFRRFLIDTPLTPSLSPGGVRFGSYHQQYWVDGQRLPGVPLCTPLTI